MSIGPTNYSYHLSEQILAQPTPSQIKSVENKIGKKIQASHDNGDSYTPHNLLNAGLFGITGAAAFLCPPVAVCTGLLAATNYFFIPDYDSPEDRKKVMRDLAQASFETIATHNVDDVIGYRLLDKIKGLKQSTPEHRAFFYASFQKLGKEYHALLNWRNDQVDQVCKKWSDETSYIRKNTDISMNCYRDEMQPWNDWREGEIQKIKSIFTENLSVLESNFQDLKKTFSQ